MTTVSVIIPCVNGFPGIDECLSALIRQRTNIDYEIIVANRCQDGTAEQIQRRFPQVRLLHFNQPISIPGLRAAAMGVAAGEIIAITEDHCIVCDNWLTEVVNALNRGYSVVGGAIENGKTDRILDWSAFLCEYSSSMPPIHDGEVDSIPGNNAAYRREALDLVDENIKRDFWEYFLIAELKKKGIKLLSVPSMQVLHKKEFGFFYFLSQRFNYSRSFAGMRRGRMTPALRFCYVLGSPLLPVLHGVRVARDVIKKRRFFKEFLLSVPSLSAYLVAHATGEFVGYLWGAGSSLNKVQ